MHSSTLRILAGLAALGLSVTACDSAEKNTKAKTADAGKKADAKKPDAKADKDAAKKAEDAPADAKKDAPADAKKDAPAADAEKKADEAPPAEAAAEAPALPPGDPGAAYFAIDQKGVFMLDGGEFKKVKKGPDKLVRQMSIGADGKPYMLTYDGVMALDGAAAKVVAKTSFKKTGSVDSFAVTSDGQVWTVGYKGIGHHDGKKWALEDKKVLGDDVSLLNGVALDKEGRVWISSSNKLHYKDGEAWKDADLSKATSRKPFFDGLTTEPSSGALVAVASSAVLRVTGPDAIEAIDVPSDTISSFGLLSYAANGIGALKTSPKQLARLTPDGKATTFAMEKDFQGTRVLAMSVDGQGRVWVGTDIGISVVGPADERASWMMGSVPELAGKIKGILVVGAGPELPEVGEVKTGGLEGLILVDDKPLAEAEIEICPEPGSLIKASPCEESPTKFQGKTGADGKFTFADVPLGAYGVAVKVEDKWKITFAGQYGTKMKEGESFDIGKLKFKSK